MGLLCVAVFTASLIVAYAHVIRMDIDHHVEAAQKPILRIVDERNERISTLVRESERRRAWPDEREIAAAVSRLRTTRQNHAAIRGLTGGEDL